MKREKDPHRKKTDKVRDIGYRSREIERERNSLKGRDREVGVETESSQASN